MNIYKYILRSLWYFRKKHFAVFLGIVISTAVLTGALIIGDSVKYSLFKLVDLRLGKAKYAMQTGDRFVRSQLARELSQKLNIDAASLLILNGIAINTENQKRVNKTQIVGIDSNFWKMSDIIMPNLLENEVIINSSCAHKLNININEELLIRVDKVEEIPANAPFVAESNPSVSLRVKIKAIANDELLGRFSLQSNQITPVNIFISRDFLAKQLKLKNLSNTILIAGNSELNEKIINRTFSEIWKLEDVGLSIRKIQDANILEIVSNRIFIDDPTANAIKSIDLNSQGILTYLANSIETTDKETPYSFVSALNDSTYSYITENDIIINDWLANDLQVQKGDSITLKYFVIGPLRSLEEKSTKFEILEIVPIILSETQKSLMPKFPGLSDAGSCRDWNAGIPINLDKVRDKDEDYWKKYKGTPKAYISLETGIKIWNNRFGKYTAFRFNSEEILTAELGGQILDKLKPIDLNLIFNPVYQQGIHSATNSVNFGELFLSLSFFVIAAGIILTFIVFKLNIESRRSEFGILSGLGFEKSQILKIHLTESLLIAILGGIAGTFLGILYNKVLLLGLNTLWQDAVQTNMLSVFIIPKTMIIGAFTGILIAFFVIYLTTRKLLKQSIVRVIKKSTFRIYHKNKSKNILNILLITIGFSGSAFFVFYSVINSPEDNASLLLSAAGLMLISLLAIIKRFFKFMINRNTNELSSLYSLAIKNAARNLSGSLTIIALLAIGTFSIMITGANRKTFYATENKSSSGTGGFLYWVESTIPLLHNLNLQDGKEKYGLLNEDALQNVNFIQFHKYEGNDASCLNLNQVLNPNILGVNALEFHEKQAFSFAKLHQDINKEKPWLALNKDFGDDVIPAIADQTVITWGMKKKTGDTLYYLNESGNEIKLLLVGGLNNSIFQGNLLIADSLFMKHFPSVSGSKIMLIDAPYEQKEKIAEVLSYNLIDYGVELSLTSERLAEFNSVENTYLSVFMILGGLGVIIGTIGLGIALLRNIQERKHEFGLLLAMGYQKRNILRLIIIEYNFLLISGLLVGIIASIIGILPSLLSPSFEIPSLFILLLVVVIYTSGIFWIFLAARNAMKGELITSLRSE